VSKSKTKEPSPPKQIVLEFAGHVTQPIARGFRNVADIYNLYPSEADFRAHKKAIQNEKEAAITAALPKPELQSPLSALKPPYPRIDAEKIKLTNSEPSLSEIMQRELQNLPTNYFLASLFNPGDTLQATVLGLGAQRGKFGETDLSRYSRILPNALALEPVRRWLVLKCAPGCGDLESQFKRLWYLKKFAPIKMLVCSAEDTRLESWVAVESLSKKQIEDLMIAACEIGIDPKCAASGFIAAMPGAATFPASSTRAALHNVGWPRTGTYEWISKNYVLYLTREGEVKSK